MTSYIIEGNNEDRRVEEAKKICQTIGINPLDITIVSPEKSAEGESAGTGSMSIGVSDIKLLKQKLFLKPLRGEMKALIIQNAELLTIPAQNALLKVLEEPPNNTFIFLSTERKDVLLRTIISRCKIVSIFSTPKVLSQEDKNEFETSVKRLPELSIGESLKLAQDVSKNKQQAILWLEKSILAARALLINALSEKGSDQEKIYAALLRKLADTYTVLKTTNANTRLKLETTFLTIGNNS